MFLDQHLQSLTIVMIMMFTLYTVCLEKFYNVTAEVWPSSTPKVPFFFLNVPSTRSFFLAFSNFIQLENWRMFVFTVHSQSSSDKLKQTNLLA